MSSFKVVIVICVVIVGIECYVAKSSRTFVPPEELGVEVVIQPIDNTNSLKNGVYEVINEEDEPKLERREGIIAINCPEKHKRVANICIIDNEEDDGSTDYSD